MSYNNTGQNNMNRRANSAPAGGITSDWINYGIKLATDKQTGEFYKQVFHNKREQKQREEIMIANMDTCVFPQKSELAYKLSQIDSSQLKSLLDTEFYNSSVMNAIMCLSDVVFHGNDQSYINERVREHITSMRQIGADSVSGVALRANFDQTSQAFIVKAPKGKDDTDLVHELFVGLYGTNKLRTLVPNFAMVYGGFKCTAPLIDQANKEVVTWCNRQNSNSINYVLYENIAPGVDMATYIKGCSQMDFLNKFMQAIYSLHIANKTIDFTHYDAHSENAIIRQVTTLNNFYIRYDTENGVEYMKTNGVLTWIDYGNAHIKVEDNDQVRGYGVYTLVSHGVDARESFPLFDVFKFLGFCMYNMINEKRKDLFILASRLLKYFTSQDPYKFITQERDNYFSLPREEGLVKRSILDFTAYIRRWVPESNEFFFAKPVGNNRVLSCATGQCEDLVTILSRLGISGEYPEPTTMLQATDILRQLPDRDERSRQGLREILERRYNGLLNAAQKEFKSNVSEINRLLPSKSFVLAGADANAIFTKETLDYYREYILNIGRLIDLTQRSRALIAATNYVQNFLGKNRTFESSTDYQEFQKYHLIMDRIIQELQKDYNYLIDLAQGNSDINNYLSERGQGAWFLSGLRTIIYATSD